MYVYYVTYERRWCQLGLPKNSRAMLEAHEQSQGTTKQFYIVRIGRTTSFDFDFPRGRFLGSTWILGYAIRTNRVVRPSETAWFPQAVSPTIPSEIFVRPHFSNCTPSGRLLSHPRDKASQFQLVRGYSYLPCSLFHPFCSPSSFVSLLSFFSVLLSSFGVSTFPQDETRIFLTSLYCITKPHNIDYRDCFHFCPSTHIFFVSRSYTFNQLGQKKCEWKLINVNYICHDTYCIPNV